MHYAIVERYHGSGSYRDSEEFPTVGKRGKYKSINHVNLVTKIHPDVTSTQSDSAFLLGKFIYAPEKFLLRTTVLSGKNTLHIAFSRPNCPKYCYI